MGTDGLWRTLTRAASAALLLSGLAGCSSPSLDESEELPAGLDSNDRFIVVLQDGATASGVEARSGLAAGAVRHRYRHALRGFAARLSGAQRARLAALPEVKFIEPDLPVQAVDEPPPGVVRIGTLQNPFARIDGVDQRVDVDIAVIDTGIDLEHAELNVFHQRNFVNPALSGDDDNGHGTHVAGTAAAIDNGSGVVGVAPGARLWALKALDQFGNGSISSILAAIDYATAHASEIEVVNMSLGGWGQSLAERQAIQRGVAAGVVFVVAAGNDGEDIFGPDRQPGVFLDFIPAAFPEVMTVSASIDTDGLAGGLGSPTGHGADDSIASFSNFSTVNHPQNPVSSPGAKIDVAAPGSAVLSTIPGGGFGLSSGTSMASPHVAGAAALYIESHGRAFDAAGVYAIRQALVNAGESQNVWRPPPTNDQDDNPEPLVRVDRFVAPVTLFFDDFAAGLAKWTESGEGDWNTEGLHAATGYPATGSGSPAAHSDDCDTECTITLSSTFDLSGYASAELSFLRFVDVEVDAGEFLRIDAWNGASWQTLASWGGGNGDDDRWHAEFIDLSAYLGVSSFRLRAVTKQNGATEHVHLDDVRIVAGVGGPPPSCGDGTCGESETCSECPADCGPCPAVCGNASCEAGETCGGCPADCGPCPAVCGNASCEAGETCGTCPADCGPCPAVCGNASCEAGETCGNCPADCGACPAVCGNASCEAGETCGNCPADCGACPAVCGNASCEAGETCGTCPADCGTCTTFTTLFSDNFSSLAQWSETGEGDWNTESLHTKTGYPSSGSGTPAAHSDDCRTECTLTLSTPLDLSQCGDATLELLRFLDVELDAGEFLRIDAWNGVAWQTVASWGGGNGDDDQWHAETISLSAFVGSSNFQLRLVTKQNNAIEHVHVDDLRISGADCGL